MSTVPDIAIGVPEGRQGYATTLIVLAVLLLAGAGSFVYMLTTAPDSIPWSFFVASYVFLLGVSQFGIAFCAMMRICRAKWSRPFYRTAELATLAFFPFAIILFLLIFAYGKEHLFFWLSPEPGEHLSPWLNADFLLIRNLVAQLLFYGLAIVYFLTGLLPDVTRESTESGPGWRRSLYKWLWSLRQRRDDRNLKSNTSFYAPLILVVAVIANTFISWDFGMMLFPHYHSTVFPLYFILGNMLAGTAGILILGAVTSRTLDLTAFFKTVQLKSMGIVITGFALLWLYMFWAQFIVTWFGNLPHETGPLWSRMYGHYAPYFWTMTATYVTSAMTSAGTSLLGTGATLDISFARRAVPGVLGPEISGSHTVQLLVTDNDGGSASDLVEITVNGAVAANLPPVSNAGLDLTVTDFDGNTLEFVHFDGRASSDPDGSIVSYIWTEFGNTINNAATFTITMPLGVHTVELTVTDNQGATDSDTVVITVLPAGPTPPIDSFSGTPTSITLGNSSTLSWTTTGADSCRTWPPEIGSSSIPLRGSRTSFPRQLRTQNRERQRRLRHLIHPCFRNRSLHCHAAQRAPRPTSSGPFDALWSPWGVHRLRP
ncbi:MAG: hypothetical protein IIC61_02280 [Proteobacteria bacterium]|nr:hypothetical protein [Pseudomonadota bacterium]